MQKTELKIENIYTNHLLEEARYTVINAIRSQAGNYEGIQLVESNILFYYLGRNYYLDNGNVFNDEGVCLLQNYRRHFEKDGKLYLESMNNALYKLSKDAPVMQQHKQKLYGEREIYYNSLTIKNIPFIGTGNEISYINTLGQVFYINFQDGYYWLCSNDGKKLEKFILTFRLPISQKIFFLLAPQGIEFIIQKNNAFSHYSILGSSFSIENRPFTDTLLDAQYIDNKLALVYERDNSIFYKIETEEYTIINSVIDSIKEKLDEAINNKEYQTVYNKSVVVENGTTTIDNESKTKYKAVSSTEYLNDFQLFSHNESSICKIDNNCIALYTEISLTLKENSYTFVRDTKNYCIGKESYEHETNQGGNGMWVTLWRFIYGSLTNTSYYSQTPPDKVRKIIISVVSVFNIENKIFEAINIHFHRIPLSGFNPYGYANISKYAITIDYETYVTDEADKKDQNKNKFLLTNFNYPLEKNIKEYINNNITGKLILDLDPKKDLIGWKYERGQEHTLHNYIMKTEGLEFMNGNINISKYNNLEIKYYPKKNQISPYEGEKSLMIKALNPNSTDEKPIEDWRMYSSPISYHENLLVFCIELEEDRKYEIMPTPLPKIRSYSTGGANTFVVMESDLNSVQIRDHTKKIDSNFLSIDDTIEEIEATIQGTFIGGKTSLRYLRAIATGEQIQLYQETVKFDHVVENIGQEIIFFYGNGFIHYLRENKLVSEIWKIKEAPLKAIKVKNTIVIQTADLLWILTIKTGEIALLSLSQEKTLTLDYSIRDEDGQGYFLKNGNPSFSFSWSQQGLRRIRSISSFSHILGGSVGEQIGGVVKIHDKYKINLRGILKSGVEVKTTFKDRIAKNIIIETY